VVRPIGCDGEAECIRALTESWPGLEMIEELGRHGYALSAGTMYPILHRLEEDGLLRSKVVLARDGRRRRLYRLTPAGRRALRAAKQKVRELFGELFEHE